MNMKLTELIRYAETALCRFGDLECCIDSDEEDACSPIEELLMEVGDNGEKHILLTAYDVGFTILSLVK